MTHPTPTPEESIGDGYLLVYRNLHLVLIRDNETGIVRAYEDAYLRWVEDDFIWTEGNFACDCNRGLFFARAVGEDGPDRACGSERYSVMLPWEDEWR